MWQTDSRSIFFACIKCLLAWKLFEVQLLWLSFGRCWFNIIHTRKCYFVQKWLYKVRQRFFLPDFGFLRIKKYVLKNIYFILSFEEKNRKNVEKFENKIEFPIWFQFRLYGNTGLCSACNKLIPAFEMVMRAKRNVYHLECFACQTCSHR